MGAELSELHRRARQAEPGAQEALFRHLDAELEPRIERLLQEDGPYRRYLSAAELLGAARQRFLDRPEPPERLGLWLSGVAQEHLLRVLLRPERLADEDAVNAFYQLFRPMLEPIVRRWLHRSPIRKVVDTIDLVHTAYHRLANHVRRKGEPPPHLGPWLNKVVRHRVFELFRRHARTVMLSEDCVARLEADDRAPHDVLADREEVERLLLYMGPITRELHRLHVCDGLGWRAAGAAVGLSAGAARQRWYKWLMGARQQAGAAETIRRASP